jgi:hypothetical protein
MTPAQVRLHAEFVPWDRLPVPGLVPALRRWVALGVAPGGFLDAALRNDLRWTVINADSENRRCILAWVLFLHHELPAPCWGSAEAVSAWAAHRGLAGLDAAQLAQDASGSVAASRLRALSADDAADNREDSNG